MLIRRAMQMILAGLLLLAVGCTTTSTPDTPTGTATGPDSPEADRTIVLADVSDEPAKKIKRFQPLADYLAAHLGEYGITSGEVKVAPDIETMIAWMQAGEVDLYFDSLYPAMLVIDQGGGIPILRRWKDGEGEYHSVIFTRSDSGLDDVSALSGQMIAFEELGSTSGYMMPLAYLIEAGLNVAEKADPSASVANDELGYTFSGEDANTLQWVVSGTVIAGATDNVNYEELVAESEVELKILAETEAVARQVTVARGDLEPDLLAAITTLLLELDESEEGLAVLDEFKTSQFDEFPGGSEAAFARMRELFDLVQSQ